MGRKCSKCGVIQQLSAFDPLGNDPSKLQGMCRTCITKIWKRVVGNRTQTLQDLREKNPDAYDRMVVATLYTNAARRAKKLGIDFRIQKDDIPLVHICPVFGYTLRLNPGKQSNESYSLDRLDSELGYVPGNIRVISWHANYLKGRLNVEQARKLVEYMEGKV